MIYTLLLTAFTVSIDSYFCGFSLSLVSQKKTPIVLSIFFTVLVMCLVANYCVILIAINVLEELSAIIGGTILIAIGIFNLVKKDEENKDFYGGTIKKSIMTGFAVGLDGSVANLSLAIMGINGFYVPLTIAVTHAVTIWLGIITANCGLCQKLKKASFVAPLILILLGAYKIVSVFI